MRDACRLLLLHAVTALLVAVTVRHAWGQGWYNGSWGYRQSITINDTKVPADLTGFDTPVNFANASTGFSTHALADACDVRFTQSDGTTEVPVDIDFDRTSYGWFLSSPTHSASAVYYMYYGNAGASCYAANAANGTNNVYTAYNLAFHLPNGTSLTATDLTSGGHNGTVNSATATAGQVDGGANFSGASNINVPDVAALRPGAGSLSVMLWANPPSSNQTTMFASKRQNSGSFIQWTMGISGTCTASSTGQALFATRRGASSNFRDCLGGSDVADGAFHQYASVWDASGDTQALYVDGATATSTACALQGAGCVTGVYPSLANTDPIRIGDGNGCCQYAGVVDDFREAFAVLSANWITTWYNATKDNSTFITFGAEEAQPTSTPTSTDTPAPTDTPTPTATNTNTPTNTATPTFTLTDTPTPTATQTSTPTTPGAPTLTPTDTPTATPTPTETGTPTNTATATNTARPTSGSPTPGHQRGIAIIAGTTRADPTPIYAIGGATSTTEGNEQFALPFDGKLDGLRVHVATPVVTGTQTFTWRKAGTNTAVFCTISGGADNCVTANTQTFTGGDLLALRSIGTAGADNPAFIATTELKLPDGSNYPSTLIFGGDQTTCFTTPSIVCFCGPLGTGSFDCFKTSTDPTGAFGSFVIPFVPTAKISGFTLHTGSAGPWQVYNVTTGRDIPGLLLNASGVVNTCTDADCTVSAGDLITVRAGPLAHAGFPMNIVLTFDGVGQIVARRGNAENSTTRYTQGSTFSTVQASMIGEMNLPGQWSNLFLQTPLNLIGPVTGSLCGSVSEPPVCGGVVATVGTSSGDVASDTTHSISLVTGGYFQGKIVATPAAGQDRIAMSAELADQPTIAPTRTPTNTPTSTSTPTPIPSLRPSVTPTVVCYECPNANCQSVPGVGCTPVPGAVCRVVTPLQSTPTPTRTPTRTNTPFIFRTWTPTRTPHP